MDEWKKRVELLEEEVRLLKSEIQSLKSEQFIKRNPVVNQHKNYKEPETAGMQPRVVHNQKRIEAQQETLQKPKKTLEESVLSILPKVFMFILVLGVLWGLKLVSDQGVLTDSVKIVLAYLLSISLAAMSFALEKRKKSVPTMHAALYGGSFIIGILTTAAAVLLYDLFSTTTALFIAIVYIVYGIFISYVKANEGLTIFVMLVSLLLPYLLEYMNSSKVMIIGFIIVLFVTMQWITVKLTQKYAQIIIGVFTGISILSLYVWNGKSVSITLISWVILMAVSSLSWLMLYPKVKKKALAVGTNYSLSVFGLIAFWILLEISNKWAFGLLLVVAFIGISYVAWKKQREFDLFVAITSLALMVLIGSLTIDVDIRLLLAIIAAGIGVYLGLPEDRRFMRITNSSLLVIQTLLVYRFSNLETGLGWLLHVTPLIIGIILIINLVKRKILMDFTEVIRVLVYFTLLFFVYKIETEYGIIPSNYYIIVTITALTALVSFMLSEKWRGKIVPYIAFFLFVICNLFAVIMYPSLDNVLLEIMLLGTHLIVWLAYIVSFVQEKYLYQNVHASIFPYKEWIIMVASFGFSIVLWKLCYVMKVYGWISESIFIISSTVILFTFSIFLLTLGKKGRSVCLKGGLVVLFIAIGKLMFFDLSSLSMFIRAIFFMIVGGIGLVITNKMLKQQNVSLKEEEK